MGVGRGRDRLAQERGAARDLVRAHARHEHGDRAHQRQQREEQRARQHRPPGQKARARARRTARRRSAPKGSPRRGSRRSHERRLDRGEVVLVADPARGRKRLDGHATDSTRFYFCHGPTPATEMLKPHTDAFRLRARSVVAVGAFAALVALLRFEAQGRDRPRFEPAQGRSARRSPRNSRRCRPRCAASASSIFDTSLRSRSRVRSSRERSVSSVARSSRSGSARLSSFNMPQGFRRLGQQLRPPAQQLLAEIFALRRVHEFFVRRTDDNLAEAPARINNTERNPQRPPRTPHPHAGSARGVYESTPVAASGTATRPRRSQDRRFAGDLPKVGAFRRRGAVFSPASHLVRAIHGWRLLGLC